MNAEPAQTAISPEQIRQAFAATLEVLQGAGPGEILKLVEQISVAKMILRGIVSGELVVGRQAASEPDFVKGKANGAEPTLDARQ